MLRKMIGIELSRSMKTISAGTSKTASPAAKRAERLDEQAANEGVGLLGLLLAGGAAGARGAPGAGLPAFTGPEPRIVVKPFV